MSARVYVDFNELIEPNVVLLSKQDVRLDAAGCEHQLFEGLALGVYMDDRDKAGEVDNLIADGVVERNSRGGSVAVARWVLRIDSRGIRHESDEG